MIRFKYFLVLTIIGSLFSCKGQKGVAKKEDSEMQKHPNIVLILADDMGYGDARCYNANSKVPTPNIDKLASEGMMFMDAHTNSSVCTPTRYGIITGQYSWRSSLKKGVTWSYDSLIIDTKKSTIASILKDQGYRTAAIGKWHLGLGWQRKQDSVQMDLPLTAGPVNLGFNYFYGIAASLDIPPYVYIHNNEVVEQPTGFSQGTATSYHDDFWRRGPISPDFDHYKVLGHLRDKAEEIIKKNSGKDKPFFLYLALTAPHLPWIPTEEFKGKSKAGNYGDLTAEVDGVVGDINQYIKDLGIEGETLVIFTSDNGSQFSSANMKKYQHFANGQWRGRKGDIYEGGNRVPFIVKWPGKIKPASQSEQLVSTTDFYATFADILGETRGQGEKKDSYSFLPALMGKPQSVSMRKTMVYHSAKGMFAFRNKDWVLVKGKGSGGFLEAPDTTGIEEPYQLYNLKNDTIESVNRYGEENGRTENMLNALQKVIDKK